MNHGLEPFERGAVGLSIRLAGLVDQVDKDPVVLLDGAHRLPVQGQGNYISGLGYVLSPAAVRRTLHPGSQVISAQPHSLPKDGIGFVSDPAPWLLANRHKGHHAVGLGHQLHLLPHQLGKVRRDALRDMADRIGASEMDSFVAAVIQSEQLGVSMAKVLRIQSDDMRVKRRQRAEAEAQKAPVKMLFPMALLVFPTIMMILLGPAALQMMRSSLGSMLGM